MAIDTVLPYESTFDALYGLEVHSVSEEEATASVPVRDAVKQPMGLVHGGLFASIAESLASMATAMGVMEDGKQAMGLSNATSFLRPITEGTVHATARRVHRGRSTWVWDVEITDDQGRRCALTRMTIAVR
jgi:1,4-dihydroxy-2-naphthoyl-CoA hydrolase